MNLAPQPRTDCQTFQSRLPVRATLWSCLILAGTVLAGCGRNDIKVYSVPRENIGSASTMPAGHPDIGAGMSGGGGGMGGGMNLNMSGGVAMGMPAPPKVSYKKPDGWTEAPSGAVRVASFGILKDGQKADVSVVPLSGAAGGDTANVNRWRGQISLEDISAEALQKSAEPIAIAGFPAELYDILGTDPSTGLPCRILGAIQHRDGTAWFFKMTGDDKLVAGQKPVFIEFLKSVSFESTLKGPPSEPSTGTGTLPAGHPEISATAPAAAPSSEGKPNWQVPSGWQEVAGGQFLVAKFMIAGEANSQAAVNVSMSAGAGGGVAGNVNRWRTQLGLGPLADAEMEKQLTPVEVSSGKAMSVDFSGTDSRTGQPARTIGIIVPQAGQTWFYKLMGDSKLVEAQKDAFTKFVQSVKY